MNLKNLLDKIKRVSFNRSSLQRPLPKTVKIKVVHTKPVSKKPLKSARVIVIDKKKMAIVVSGIAAIAVLAFSIHAFVSPKLRPAEEKQPQEMVINTPEVEPDLTVEPEVPPEPEKPKEGKELPVINLAGEVIELESSMQRINEPTPWGREVLYSAGNAPNINEPIFEQLFLYNVDTKEEKVVSESNIKFGEIYEGRFNDQWVVWMDTNQSGLNELYSLNRKTGDVSKVKTCKLNKPQLVLYGDNMVWVEQKDLSEDRLYLYNLKSGEPISLETFENNPTYGTCPPAIYDDVLVWVCPNGNDPNTSIIKKLDLNKLLTVPQETEDPRNIPEGDYEDAGKGSDEGDIQIDVKSIQENQDNQDSQNDQEVQGGQESLDSQQVDANEEGGDDDAIEPEVIDPKGFAIYPATNGNVIAWLDNLDPSKAHLKMTGDNGKTIIDVAYGVGRFFDVGDNFIVYTQDEIIMLYFWEIDRYARLTGPGDHARLSKASVNGNLVVWYDANDPKRKDDIVKYCVVKQPDVEQKGSRSW